MLINTNTFYFKPNSITPPPILKSREADKNKSDMISYSVTIKKENGSKKVIISANTREQAALKVCSIENCKNAAILKVKALISIKNKLQPFK